MKAMQDQTCLHCGARFMAQRSTAKYCSDRCRIGAHRGEPRPLASVWLRKAAIRLAADVFKTAGVAVDPGSFDVSFGYPLAMQRTRTIGGRTHYIGGLAIGTSAIVIPPQPDPIKILSILAHEMVHIVAPGDGHRAPFQRIAGAIGLLPPWITTPAGPELIERIKQIAVDLGPMPTPADFRPPVPMFSENADGAFSSVEGATDWTPPAKRHKRKPGTKAP